MKFDSSTERLAAQLKKDWALLKRSEESLQISLKKCKAIGIKNVYSFEESESFDALTSKFGRTSDMFTQKILKTAFLILREEAQTFVDRANMAEKLGMTSSTDSILQIRDLRNSIAHEYETDALNKIYAGVLSLTPTLFREIMTAQKYFAKRKWI
ncbi:MAG: hypothetical protein M1469_07680 [Bacteroidetes bacterium]|nr:hypothetical protein [Bacteroidota bacterium]